MNQSVLNKIVMIKHMLLDINVMLHYYYSNITVYYYIILIIYIMISELFYAILNLPFFLIYYYFLIGVPGCSFRLQYRGESGA